MGRARWMVTTPISLLTLALGACDASSMLGRSCGGQRVRDECAPYTYAVVTGATFTEEVPIGDPLVRPEVTVDLSTCGASTPEPVQVRILALTIRDGGTRVEALTTLTASARDANRIEATIDNPFAVGGSVAGDSRITLRFVPVVDGCEGEAFSLEYRTGPAPPE